jgi:hypothetical protein
MEKNVNSYGDLYFDVAETFAKVGEPAKAALVRHLFFPNNILENYLQKLYTIIYILYNYFIILLLFIIEVII